MGADHPGEIIVKFKIAALALVLMGGSGAALADGSFVGSHFTVSYLSADQNMFGTPTLLSNDVLRWRPPLFSTDTDFGPVTSTALVTIQADAGYTLTGFTFYERGNYEAGATDGGGTASVRASGFAKITRLTPAASSVTHTFDTGIISTPTFDAVAGFDNGPSSWDAATAPIALSLGTTKIQVQISNLLWASANAEGFSQLRKTTADLGITTSPVPEPETYAMMLAGLGALGFLARRRRNG